MRSVALTNKIISAVTIPFDKLIYPNDEMANCMRFRFARAGIRNSAHYLSCEQLDRGDPVTELEYLKWTIEKLQIFGRQYEKFLFSDGKGCGISEYTYAEIENLEDDMRHRLLAESVTTKFAQLFHSIMANWDPDTPSNDIEFYRLLNNKFTLYEGRHRICILVYKYGNNGYQAFETDRNLIRNDYYLVASKSRLRRIAKKILKISN